MEHIFYTKKTCYDKFVKILYSKGLQQESEKDENPSKRCRSDRLTPAEPTVSSVKWFYGDKCQMCGHVRKRESGKLAFPNKIVTTDAEEVIKNHTKAKRPDLYSKIETYDLIAHEFKIHRSCYRMLTHDSISEEENCPSTSNTTPSPSQEPSLVSETEPCPMVPAGHSKTSQGDNSFSNAEEEGSNFDKVVEHINQFVIEQQATSMKTLHTIYGGKVNDKRYRGKLKLLIKNKFSDEVIFFRSSYHRLEVIISKVAVIQNFHDVSNKDIYLKKAADYLQQDILKYAEEVPSESIWPPTANSLLSEDRHLPKSLVSFLEKLLSKTDTHHKVSPTVLHLVES